MKYPAQTLLNRKQEILSLWEEKVNKRITTSRNTNTLVLRDHLPNMIENIATIFARYNDFSEAPAEEKYREIVEASTDHGRYRAASADYTIDQVIHEYIIFHRVLTQVLREENAYQLDVADLLKYIIETAMLQSASSFTVSLQEVQEKLVGTLAHDIRNPISTAYSLLGLLAIDQGEQRFETLREMAINSLQKSLRLTEGLLDSITVKAGEGIMLTFTENNVAKEVRAVYNEACEVYKQKFNLECPEEMIGTVDGTAIRRLLENLVSNAVKYGDLSQPITIKAEESDDEIHLSVRNFGNPIPPEKQESIFNFLNHNNEDSTTQLQSWGMGLTLVKIIAEAHDGHIKLLSSSAEGTRFTAVLNKNNPLGKVRTQLNSVKQKQLQEL